MNPNQPGNYKVDYSEAALRQIKHISTIAGASGRRKDLADILTKALEHLERDPTAWGDPSYHVSAGGLVYHSAGLRPLVFRYAVFEEIRTSVLIDVRIIAPF